MANISLTAALRSNLLSLQGTQSLLDTTQLRLATGKKVNSALDNASAFFASQALTNRANDLSNLLDSMSQAVQVLKAADQGITSLTKLTQQAQAIAQSAQSGLSSSSFIRSGDLSAANVANLTSGAYANNDAFSVQVGATTLGTVTITTGMTLAQLATAINALSTSTNSITATVVAGSSTSPAGSQRLEIRSTAGSVGITTTAGGSVPKFQALNATTGVVGITSTGTTIATATTYAASTNVTDQAALEFQYGTVMSQITALISDTGYQGTNLLNGDTLNVQFNERNTSKLSVSGVTYNASGLGMSSTPNATFNSSANITVALNQVTAALSSLRSQAATFGNNLNVVQTRQDFTANLVNTLKAGSDQLTLADKNEEGANLLSLQTAQQLGIQALALASQANQSVLRLFQ